MNQQRDPLRDLIADEAASMVAPLDLRDRVWSRLDDAIKAGAAPRSELLAAPMRTGVPWKLLVLLGLLAAGLAVAWLGETREPPPTPVLSAVPMPTPPPPVPSPAPIPSITPLREPPLDAPPSAEPLRESPPPTTRTPASKRRSVPSPTADTRDTGDSDDFAAELRLIARAQAAEHAGDTATALKLLRLHARDYPNGHFLQDREALRAVVLCNAEDPRGKKLAASFLAAYPDSIHADRVRDACPA